VKLVHSLVATALIFTAAASGPRTRAERSDYKETSTYSDVIAFLDSLHGRRELTFGTIGKTTQGRDIPYVIASRPRVSTPAEARALHRPIVYVQANIHAGEVEGKEALLALLRDLTSIPEPNVLDSIILIAVPIYNADGNEKFASQEVNREEQNGPELVGERANAQGLDLNRDYVKAEAPETRASLAMFNAWDPDVFVDLHTTDGSFHGYALTYSPSLNPASPLSLFTRESLLQTVSMGMEEAGFSTFDYGNFISEDSLSKGWATYDSRPRFGTNYYGLRGRIAILSEAYSHDPFKRRIAATYRFVKEILSAVAAKAGVIHAYTNATSHGPSVWHVPGREPVSIPIQSKMIAAPEPVAVLAEVLEHTGDSTRTQPGVPRGIRRTGRFRAVKMPVFDRFEPTLLTPPPVAYAIPASDTQAVQLLRMHGVTVDVLTKAVSVRAERFIVDSTVISPRVFQKHHEVQLTGRWVSEPRELSSGTYIVGTEQPLGIVAVYLLEPQSDDGLVTWNFFDNALTSGSAYPVLRLMNDPRAASR